MADSSDNDLINAAREARGNAYCHYSGYSVGAAIVDEHGHLHIGCNVENAAYPLGNCADAAAIAAMVLNGSGIRSRSCCRRGFIWTEEYRWLCVLDSERCRLLWRERDRHISPRHSRQRTVTEFALVGAYVLDMIVNILARTIRLVTYPVSA